MKEEMVIKEEKEMIVGENSDAFLIDIKEEIGDVIKEEHLDFGLRDNELTEEECEGSKLVRLHKCPYTNCGKAFSRPWRLESHICFHTGKRPHKCDVLGCGKAYFNTSHLRRHITTTHSPASLYKKLLKCPHPGCLTELSNPQNLKRHIYRKHQRVYPFQCEFCDKGFTRQSQLQSHLYQHTGILPITCSYCQLRFRTQRDLKRHERSHSNIYACDFPNCEEMFQRRVHLLKHITVDHPSEFICDVCKKSFKTKCRLLVHMAVHQDTTQREVIRCPYINCSRFYYHKRNLTFHIQARHKGKKKKTKEVFCTIWPKKETKNCLSHDEYLSTESSPSSSRTAAIELGLKPEIFIAIQGESMQK